MMHGQKKTSK